MDKKQIEQIIKIYIKSLSNKIKVDKVLLFGSSVKGRIGRNSDIDLLVLSDMFYGMDTDKRMDILYTAREDLQTQSVPMDIFGLTKKEYISASNLSLVGEIKENGLEIPLN